jgi:Tol biopolymer transport system component
MCRYNLVVRMAWLGISVLIVSACSRTPGPQVQPGQSLVQRITTISEEGGRLDWSPMNNLIVRDKLGPDGYFQIYSMKPDTLNLQCLTCDKPEAPTKHKGNPAWHPSGEYIVFQAEQESHPGISFLSNPGSGANSDLWLMTSDGNRYFRLTNLGPKRGVLHPHFSHSGTMLTWAEIVDPQICLSCTKGRLGGWALKLADFVVDASGPRLANIRTYRPGDPAFYETNGFSIDDTKLIFTGNLEPDQLESGQDVYTLEIKTQKLERLTTTLEEWDEHAHYSPNGKVIIWMSSTDSGRRVSLLSYKTDYWIMNADGSNKVRLTYFNQPGHPDYIKGGVIAADFDWSPDGTKIYAYLILSIVDHKTRNVLIELKARP